MATLNGFDASTVQPTDFSAIPAGKYLAVITHSEMKPTKNNTGSYLELTFQIAEGEHRGRNLWARLNLDNPNPVAVKIAQGDLAAICHAVGVLAPKDSCDLHNLALVITVRCRKREDTGEITNEIRGYAGRATTAEPATQAAADTPPWTR